jgi:DNA-binding transcriptional MerR regulator
MFTQLDLFGDLPAPEKPSNQPQRAEKKSAARHGNASSATQPVQTQLSMGLTEHTYPEPSRDWSGQEEIQQPVTPDSPVATEAESIGNNINKTEDLLEIVPATSDSIQDASEITTSTTTEEISQKPTEEISVTSQETHQETRAEKGRRYYIQTEIPADPPLAEKPPGPEMMMAGMVNTRNTALEPKPRYIQTEIPSEPLQSETKSEQKTEEEKEWGNPLPAVQEQSAGAPASAQQSTEEHPVVKEQKQDESPNAIPAESLRRTRPLMPPKMILAEPDQPAEAPPAQRASTHVNPSFTTEEHPKEPTHKPVHKKVESELFPNNTETLGHVAELTPTSTTTIGEKTESNIHQPASRRKKVIKEPVLEIAIPGVPPDEQLNARQYYSIGEVATMFGVKSSLLRYWESEFEVLKLRKNRKGDRFFRPDDIRSLQLIHHLLRDKKYTIEGAREYMRNAGKMKEKFETIEALQRIRQFLVEMKNGLQIERIPEAQ